MPSPPLPPVLHRCARSTTPAFLKTGKDEDFYVRAGPASQILGYIEARKTT